MAYTPVPTVSTGDSWTAQDMNRYVKDNFAAGVPGLMTTKGDIVAATGVDAAARVGVGANDSVLFANSNKEAGMEFGDQDNEVRTHGDGGSHGLGADDAVTKLTCISTEDFDTGGNFSSDRFTASQPGFYYISCSLHYNWTFHVSYGPYEGEYLRLKLYKNGALETVLVNIEAMSDSDTDWRNEVVIGGTVLWLDVDDYIEFYGQKDYNALGGAAQGHATLSHISIRPIF